MIDGDVIVRIEEKGFTTFNFSGTFIVGDADHKPGDFSAFLPRQSYTLLPESYTPAQYEVKAIVSGPDQYSQEEREFIDRALIGIVTGLCSDPNIEVVRHIEIIQPVIFAMLTQRRAILGKKEGGDE